MADDPSQAQGMDPAGVNLPLIGQDEIQRRRALAQAMMARGVDYSPVQSWTQGAARLADAAVGAYGNYSAGKLEQQMNQADLRALAPYLGLGGGGATASPTPVPAPSPLPPTAPPPPPAAPVTPTPDVPPQPSIQDSPSAGTPGVSPTIPGETPIRLASNAPGLQVGSISSEPGVPGKKVYGPTPGEDTGGHEGVPYTPPSGRAQVAQAMTSPPTAQAPSPTGQQDPRALLALAMRGGRLSPIATALLAKRFEPQRPLVVGAGATAINPVTGKPLFTAPEKPPSGFERAPGGGIEPEPGFAEGKAKIAGDEAKAKAEASPYSQESIDFAVDRFIAGDSRAATGFGYGAAGAAARKQFNDTLAQRASEGKISAQDLLTKQAEFKALSAAEMTAGRRSAQADTAAFEAKNMMKFVRDASTKVSRTQYPNMNSFIEAWQKGTGGTDVIAFGNYINSLINSYSRAINPTGQGTEGDKKRATDMLDMAWSDGQIGAALDAMNNEIEAALRAPGQTMESIRQTWGQGGLSPGGEVPQPPTASTGGEWITLPDGTRIRQMQ